MGKETTNGGSKNDKEKAREDDLIAAFDLENPELPKGFSKAAMASGGYPYDKKLDRDVYEDELWSLQVELVKLQKWVRENGRRIILVFEGRDAAGKGGTINAFRENMNPRQARIVALDKPTQKERGQLYFQRYIAQFPTEGEIVLFDRSWYNRGVVERVMGFCTEQESEDFLDVAPQMEVLLSREGIDVVKFWLNIGQEMQMKRFHDRRHDPLKTWKISPVDLAAMSKWDEFTEARDRMLERTHTPQTPWTIVRTNDKRRGRLNAIRHVLRLIDYTDKDRSAIGAIDPNILGTGPEFLLETGD